MEKIDKMKELIAMAEIDSQKFEKGNRAAGTRLRKLMQEIKTIAQEIRNEVTDQRTAQKIKVDNYSRQRY